jgi:hypothetical protein
MFVRLPHTNPQTCDSFDGKTLGLQRLLLQVKVAYTLSPSQDGCAVDNVASYFYGQARPDFKMPSLGLFL